MGVVMDSRITEVTEIYEAGASSLKPFLATAFPH
jgi:hypothetical protein